jgi:hypothetical protein
MTWHAKEPDGWVRVKWRWDDVICGGAGDDVIELEVARVPGTTRSIAVRAGAQTDENSCRSRRASTHG